MSAALQTRGDSSSYSLGTLQDLSLGSMSSVSPPKLRVPSTTSQTTAPSSAHVLTPSPPSLPRRQANDNSKTDIPLSKRIAFMGSSEDTSGEDSAMDASDALKTPRKGVDDDLEMITPMGRTLSQRKSSSGIKTGSNLTLRDQEKHIDSLKKENFNIKLKVHFLEERLAQLAPDQIDAALKQNINLKIEVQQRGLEMKKYKKLLLELERELEKLQRSQGGHAGRERELEEKLRERERELRDMRRKHAGVGGRNGGDTLRQLEMRNAQLEEQNEQLADEMDNAKALLEENNDEIERLQDILQQRGGENGSSHVEDLEVANEELRLRLEEQNEILALREEEKEDMADEIEGLRLKIDDLERKHEAEILERSQSRAQIIEEREEREAVEEDLNALRDKLAASAIEMTQKDDELDMKAREIDELVAEHDRIVENVEQEWRVEVEEARAQVEELRDAIAERDAESKELRMQISELEAEQADLNEKFEAALEHLEREAEDKDAEIVNANQEIQKLGQRVYELEDEVDGMRDETARIREDEAVERERLETLTVALKEKLSSTKSQLQETTELYEKTSHDIVAHRARQEELARHVEDLVEECNRLREECQIAIADRKLDADNHENALRRERRALDEKESALRTALSDLARTQQQLAQRDADVQDIQDALKALEAESRRDSETHHTDRFSLQLEVDRLKRDLERLEGDLARARKDVEDRENKFRERDAVFDKLHAENRDLASELASQTQARLNISEKLDAAQSSLRKSESELASYRSRVEELEKKLSKDQKSLLNAESTYRDQLTERNTLLLTIYQYMDKILGVDKTPKNAESKPFTNFPAFHDNIVSRLKALSQIQNDYEKRSKDIEVRYTEKLTDLKKQLDSRWRQIDKFEASLKILAEAKQSWKRRLNLKDGELEALKSLNSDLAAQLSSSKRPGQADSMEVKALQARATNAERRLTNAQNQLLAAEEKMAAQNQKTTMADTKWEARVKEYEARLKSTEERVKRERQGAKERVAELETTIANLKRQIELAHKRNSQLSEVIEATKPAVNR